MNAEESVPPLAMEAGAATPTDGNVGFRLPSIIFASDCLNPQNRLSSINAEEPVPPPEEPVLATATDGHATGIVTNRLLHSNSQLNVPNTTQALPREPWTK